MTQFKFNYSIIIIQMSQTAVYGSIYIELPDNFPIELLAEKYKEFMNQCSVVFDKDYGPCPWIIEPNTIEAEIESQKGNEVPYVKWLQIIICGFLIPNNINITDYGLDYETKSNNVQTSDFSVNTGEFRIDGNMLKVITPEYELSYELLHCMTIDLLKEHIQQDYENVSYLRISETKYNEMVNKIKKYEELLKHHQLL